MTSIAEELKQLAELLESGHISAEEFEGQKAQLLSRGAAATPTAAAPPPSPVQSNPGAGAAPSPDKPAPQSGAGIGLVMLGLLGVAVGAALLAPDKDPAEPSPPAQVEQAAPEPVQLSASACPASGDSPVLVVATGKKFEPMYNMTGSSPWGFDIDLAREIARRIGKDDVSFRSVKSSRRLAARGEADMGIQAISLKPSREKENLFSLPYIESSFVVVANKSLGTVDRGDLKHLSCAVGKNHLYQLELKKIGCAVQNYKNKAAAENAVRSGESDFTVTDEANARVLSGEYSLFQPGISLGSDRYAIAMQLGNHELKTAVDSALREMRQDGTLQGLRDKYGL